MSNHTPGPWTYTKNFDYKKNASGFLILQDRTSAKNIATVIPCIGMTAEEVEANAKLLTSAANQAMERGTLGARTIGEILDAIKKLEESNLVAGMNPDARHGIHIDYQARIAALMWVLGRYDTGMPIV